MMPVPFLRRCRQIFLYSLLVAIPLIALGSSQYWQIVESYKNEQDALSRLPNVTELNDADPALNA